MKIWVLEYMGLDDKEFAQFDMDDGSYAIIKKMLSRRVGIINEV